MTNAFGISGIQNVSSYSYDNDGNQVTFTDPNNHTTTNIFDALNRQVQVQYPDGTKTSTGYDADGRSVVQTNQDGIVTWFGYDGTGRLIAVTNAASQVTRYQYDEAGNQTTQIDALNRINTYVYDGLGRKISHTMPGGQAEGFAYDLAGNQIYDTNFNGAIITNQYNAMNRLTNTASVNGYHVSFAYSPTGQRTNLIDASGTNNYSYDNQDRLLLRTMAWANGLIISLNYRYDANGEVSNIWSSISNGVNLIYNYDPLSRLTNVLANGILAASHNYDPAGNLQSLRYGNGVTNLYQYDAMNRLTNNVWQTNGNVIASFAYTLGLTGERTALTETNHGVNRNYVWKYDGLYRLTNEVVSGTAPVGTLGYNYDAVGNRTVRTNTAGSLGPANQAQTFNTNDWLQTDAYDNNGNTLWSTNGSVEGPYQYDAINRLTNYNNSVYLTYDGDGNRVKKTAGGVTTYYLVDDRNPSGYAQVLEEWTASGGATNLSRVYNYGLNLISQRVPGSSTNYFICDGHGSTRMLTDAGGNFVNAFTYDAYGILIASNSAPQTQYLYCGQQFDPDLGLYYNRARYLNEGTGRFWTMDTYTGDNEDPLSLHKYLYAEDNPVDDEDPTGMFTQSQGYLAEAAIQAVYTADHPDDIVNFGKWTRLGGLTGNLFRLKPDIFNISTKRWAEIKPFTTTGVAKAGIQFVKYSGFAAFGYLPDAGWTPSVHYATPDGWPIIFWNCGGIIFYTDATDQAEDLFAISTYALARQYITSFTIRALTLRSVAIIGEEFSNDIDTSVGVATENSMEGAP